MNLFPRATDTILLPAGADSAPGVVGGTIALSQQRNVPSSFSAHAPDAQGLP